MRQKAGAIEAQLVGVKGSCQGMIGTGRAENRNSSAIFLPSMLQNLFKFTNLVAAIQIAGEVVVLY